MGEHDGILLDRWASTGDNQAFMELVARYQGMVYGTCVRIVKDRAKAEDLVQECFLKLTKNRPKSSRTLGPWLHRVATHASINQLRSDTRRIQREKTFMSDRPSHDEATWDDIDEILDEELNTLPVENREVIVAHFMQGQTQVDVAEKLDLPRTTVSSRIKAGLDKLERKLKSRGVLVPAAALSGMMASEIANAAPATLAETMGKAVLKGTFAPKTAATSLIHKSLIGVAVALLLLVGGYAIVTNESPAENPVIETPVQQAAVASPTPQSSPPPEPVAVAATEVAADILPAAEETTELVMHEFGERFRLKCIDESGQPVAGAQVYLYQRIMGNWGTHPAQSNDPGNYSAVGPIVSDAEGYAEFAAFVGSPEQSLHRTAYAVVPDALVGTWHENVIPQYPYREPDRTIRLVATQSMPGRVISPAGHDMNSIRVDFMNVGTPIPGHPFGSSFGVYSLPEGVFSDVFAVTVDDTGSFELRNLPKDGGFNVRARAPGLGESQRAVRDVSQTDFVELPMKPHGILEGYIREEGTLNPVVGRYVTCRNKSTRGIQQNSEGVTDETGKYRIEGLTAGDYQVSVPNESDFPSNIVRAIEGISVEEGKTTENINFTVETGKVIRGRMLNEETGEPIKNIQVVALNPAENGGVSVNNAFSDANGNFEMRLPLGDSMLYMSFVPPGTMYPENQAKRVVTVSHTASSATESVDFFFNSDLNSAWNVGHGSLEGKVVDGAGNPVSGAMISAGHKYPMSGNSEPMHMGTNMLGKTDSDGRFKIPLKAYGEYQFLIGGNGWSAFTIPQWTTMEEDTTKDLGEFQLSPHDEVMSVLLIDEEGNPVSEARYGIQAKNFYRPYEDTRSDSEGMIYLKNLPNAKIRLTFGSETHKYESWNGFPGEHVEIVLKRK